MGDTITTAPRPRRGVCRGIVWDMLVDPPEEKPREQRTSDRDWWAGDRLCAGCERQAARLAELAEQQGAGL
jgi:hypothetical protein